MSGESGSGNAWDSDDESATSPRAPVTPAAKSNKPGSLPSATSPKRAQRGPLSPKQRKKLHMAEKSSGEECCCWKFGWENTEGQESSERQEGLPGLRRATLQEIAMVSHASQGLRLCQRTRSSQGARGIEEVGAADDRRRGRRGHEVVVQA